MSRGSRALRARYSPGTSSAQRPSATNPTPWPSACTPVSVRPAAAASPRIPPRRTAQRRGRAGSSRPKDRLKRGVNQGTQPVVAFDKTRFFRVALAAPKLPSPVPALSHSAPSPLQQAIAALADRRSLSEPQTTEAFGVVRSEEHTSELQ